MQNTERVKNMKTYEEMIQFAMDAEDKGTMRYVDWVIGMVLSEAYDIPRETVFADLGAEKERLAKERKLARKAKSRAENEARRLANIQRAQNEQVL